MKIISAFVSYTFFMYIMVRKFILYDGESIQVNETVFSFVSNMFATAY